MAISRFNTAVSSAAPWDPQRLRPVPRVHMTRSVPPRSMDVRGHQQYAAPDPVSQQRPRALVVDDEPYIVDLLVFLLEEEGFVVDCAFDGEQAWLIAEHTHPDIVITDISMPRVDGLELLERLRGARDLAATPVILMSAAQRPVARAHTTFLPKPFDLDQLLSVIASELAAS